MNSTLASFTLAEVEDLRRQVASLTKEVEETRKDKRALQASNDQLKKQLDKSQNRLEAQRTECIRLESGHVEVSQMNALPDQAQLSPEHEAAVGPAQGVVSESHSDEAAHSSASDSETTTMALVAQVLQHIERTDTSTQALILAPTREIAQRIFDDIDPGHDKNIASHLCVGGTKVREEKDKLMQGGIQVIVGTAGRVFDMINRRALRTDQIKVLGLVQADEMLSRGFKDQLHDIFQRLPSNVQGVLVSTSTSPEVSEFAKKFTNEPICISESTLQGIRQYYLPVEQETRKLGALLDICQIVSFTQAVVFCNSRRVVDWLTEKLKASGLDVSSIHGGIKKEQRELFMKESRSGSPSRVLVTTDILAGGIDLRQTSLVINYDFPKTGDSYIHRVSNAGVLSRKVVVLNFATSGDMTVLHDIEQSYDTKIDRQPGNVADLLS